MSKNPPFRASSAALRPALIAATERWVLAATFATQVRYGTAGGAAAATAALRAAVAALRLAAAAETAAGSTAPARRASRPWSTAIASFAADTAAATAV